MLGEVQGFFGSEGFESANEVGGFLQLVDVPHADDGAGEVGDGEGVAEGFFIKVVGEFEGFALPAVSSAEGFHGDEADVVVAGAGEDFVFEIVGVPADEIDGAHDGVDVAGVEDVVKP